MPVYVDSAANAYGRMKMSHMLADTPGELHAMADTIGIDRKWFQRFSSPHYDICQSKRRLAIEAGAIQVDRRGIAGIVRKLRESPETDWSPQNVPKRWAIRKVRLNDLPVPASARRG